MGFRNKKIQSNIDEEEEDIGQQESMSNTV